MSVRFCTLVSGSSGNASVIEYNGTAILIDCGCSAKRIVELLSSVGISVERVSGIFITHEHSDHIKGLNILSKYKIPVISHEKCLEYISQSCDRLPDSLLIRMEGGMKAARGDFQVSAFTVPHDASSCSGYMIEVGGKKITVATDMGHVTKSFIDSASGSDIVLIEANYDEDMLRTGPYPAYLKRRIASKNGHLSNSDCGEAVSCLAGGGVTKFVLGHLSENNNTPGRAYRTVCEVTARYGIRVREHDGPPAGADYALCVAPRYEAMKPVIL